MAIFPEFITRIPVRSAQNLLWFFMGNDSPPLSESLRKSSITFYALPKMQHILEGVQNRLVDEIVPFSYLDMDLLLVQFCTFESFHQI